MTLVDTACERAEPERIEARGLALGRARAARADLVLLVVDGTVGFGDDERRIWDAIVGPKQDWFFYPRHLQSLQQRFLLQIFYPPVGLS